MKKDKESGLQAKEHEFEYAHHDGGVVELESSSLPRHADAIELAICSFAVLLMICGSALAFGDFIPAKGLLAYAASSAVVIAAHQAAGPHALRRGRTQAQFFVSLGAVVLAVGFCVVVFPFVWGGFASLANNIVARLNEVYDLYLVHLPGSSASDIASVAFMVVAGLIVSISSSILMQNGSRLFLPLVLLGFMMFGRGLSISQGMAVPVITFTGELVYLAAQTRFRLTLRSFAYGAFTPLLIAVCLWLPCSQFQPLQAIADARNAVCASILEFRYGSDTLPLGRIGDSASMNSGNDERIVVRANKSPQNDVMLRGFVGWQWNGTRWVQIDNGVYYGSWQGMMEWLANNGFNPQTQVAAYGDLSSASPSMLSLDMDSVGAYRMFVYSPYALSSTDAKYEMHHDAQMNSTALFGARSYSEVVADENPERLLSADVEDLSKDEESAAFAESEMVYRAFVQEQYTQISDEDSALAQRLLLGDDWKTQDDSSLYSMVSRVRLMLQLQAYYDSTYAYSAGSAASVSSGAAGSASAGADPGNGQASFLEAFLENDHRGNSTSFATAAVLAFRSQGVPARYVEGYRLPASRFVEEGASYSATAGNPEAHAWVEVYREGVGWVPVEVTPGFYTEIREATAVVEVERNVEGGPEEDPSQGLVTGATAADQDDNANDGKTLTAFQIFLMVIGIVAALLLALLLALESQRRVRLRSLLNQCESSDQFVQVRALFDDMAYSFAAAGIPFDKGRPEDFANEVDQAFPKVLREEYVRMLELMRKSVFGGKLLKAHEVHTLARLAKTLREELPEMNGREKIMSRYRYLR